MPRTINNHEIGELSHIETKNEILLDTNPKTELHIISQENKTIIKFPFGNKFEIVDGCIIIHENHVVVPRIM